MSVKTGLGRVLRPEEPLLLAVGLDQRDDVFAGRPVNFRYVIVSASTGKKPIVAPYSGAMFAIVARSVSASAATPGPKNSTNFPTTPFFAEHLRDGEDEVGGRRARRQRARRA